MSKPMIQKGKGQSLVIVAFAMTVLLIFSAFAVDLAFWYLQRRQMQNAADAGALAGARALGMYQSTPSETLSEGQLYAIILDWAQRNGAQTVQALYIREDDSKYAINAGSGAAVPRDWTDAKGVHVVAGDTFPTFFATLVGFDSMDATAEAEAEWGGAGTAQGVIPLAVRDHPWYTTDPEETIYQLFAKSITNAPAEWGWLGLDCVYPSSCSADAADLVDWVTDGFDGELPAPASYMGDPGEKATVVGAIPVGQVAVLPLFDQIFQYTNDDLDPYTGSPRCAVTPWGSPVEGEFEGYKDTFDEDGELLMTWNPLSYCATECDKKEMGVWCAHTDMPSLVNSYYYHVTRFAAFYVTETNQGAKYIAGKFVGYVVIGDMARPVPGGVVVVGLTE